MSETHCSELACAKRGPKATGNASRFRSVGLKERDWEWLKFFATEEELPLLEADLEAGKVGNFTPLLQRAVEAARRFMPYGECGMLRNEKGQFVSPVPGTGKKAVAKRLKREMEEGKECQ